MKQANLEKMQAQMEEPALEGLPYNKHLYPTETGLFEIPDPIYRRIKALNITYAKLFNKSALHVWTAINDPASGIVGPTYHMDTGTAFHWAVLEPDRFKNSVKIMPAINKNSKNFKSWKQLYSSKLKISAADYVSVKIMVEKLREKEAAKKYLASGYPERAIIWFEPDYKIWCKGKIDWICDDGQAIVDLKKTKDASKFGFQKSIHNYQYYTQAAHYMRGFEICTGHRPREWVWIAAEIDPPNESNVFVADPVDIDMAEDKVLTWYSRFAECQKTGNWPGYPDAPIYLGSRHPQGIVTNTAIDDIQF